MAVARHSCAKCQKPAKNYIEKFVKLTDHTCACNDLTSFEYEVHQLTGSGCYLNMQQILKKLVKSLQLNLFLAGFSPLKPLWYVVDRVDGSKFDGFLTVATSWLSFKCMSAALLSYVSGVWQSGIDCFFLSEPE